MELTSNLIVAKTGKIRKELTVRNTMGTGFATLASLHSTPSTPRAVDGRHSLRSVLATPLAIVALCCCSSCASFRHCAPFRFAPLPLGINEEGKL